MKKTMFFTLIFSLIMLLAGPMYAALTDYTFVQTTGTYTEITGGLSLGTETTDDQRFVDPTALTGSTSILTGIGLPIGFSFAFNDNVFDMLAVCANGWVSLGQSTLGTSAVNITSTSSYTPLSSTSVITPTQLYNRFLFGT